MEASPSRSDSFSRAWLGCRASIERLDADADAGLGCSFNSSTPFIDMDPAELFSMRWTSSAAAPADDDEEAAEFDFGQLTCAGAQCFSPLLVGAGQPLLPYEPSIVSYSYTNASSPAFYSAQSTPASAASSRRRGQHAPAPLVATRRILLRYLRLLAPLCRKVRALPVRALAPRSSSRAAASAAATSSPARQSTSSYVSATEYWCHGHADTAVSDAILYCKKSIQGRQDAV
ncbi:hypothetical protein CFC21_001916 [Triticum aestivum]|uniref:Membrane-associated kinase regulator 6 n=2 Tax=Triticum TaxID=4564 RepID=A0A9R0Q5I8_TRITD|nr:probable membrane-associated kinase regulator 6 [Triticum dicoccoides]XP_044401275.1 probable membrane-associated kinase regulator 6 [Triticum aestivum]KAF6983806.1 hypothetical protein CFC21_001916 [Triticum aestivum]VAH05382.1 unnamed protein product [Triticum turgidum subsp. durum]